MSDAALRAETDFVEKKRRFVMASPLLRITTLTFSVEGRTILDRLDLVIHPYEIHALLGANGFGTMQGITERAPNESFHVDH